MRPTTSTLTTTILGAVLSVSTVSAQQSASEGYPRRDGVAASATAGEATTSSGGAPVSGVATNRGARYLLRNGLDYLQYQEYERALKYLREAETIELRTVELRKKNKQVETNSADLSPEEHAALVRGIEQAQRGLREAVDRQAPYAISSRTKRAGGFSVARRDNSSARRDSQVAVASQGRKNAVKAPREAEDPGQPIQLAGGEVTSQAVAQRRAAAPAPVPTPAPTALIDEPAPLAEPAVASAEAAKVQAAGLPEDAAAAAQADLTSPLPDLGPASLPGELPDLAAAEPKASPASADLADEPPPLQPIESLSAPAALAASAPAPIQKPEAAPSQEPPKRTLDATAIQTSSPADPPAPETLNLDLPAEIVSTPAKPAQEPSAVTTTTAPHDDDDLVPLPPLDRFASPDHEPAAQPVHEEEPPAVQTVPAATTLAADDEDLPLPVLPGLGARASAPAESVDPHPSAPADLMPETEAKLGAEAAAEVAAATDDDELPPLPPAGGQATLEAAGDELPPSADELPPLPQGAAAAAMDEPPAAVPSHNPSDPLDRPATPASPEPSVLDRSAAQHEQAEADDGDDLFRLPRREVTPSRLRPDLQQRVDEIAARQDEELRARSTPLPDPYDDKPQAPSGLRSMTQTQVDISRAPSPADGRRIRAIPVPDDFVPLGKREWSPQRKMWAAAATCHWPLYFQDPMLERYGHSVENYFGPAGKLATYPVDDPRQSTQRNQIAQPFFSAGLFAFQILTLPYAMVVDPPWESQYDLGYWRPGDKIPTDLYYLPTHGTSGLFGRNK